MHGGCDLENVRFRIGSSPPPQIHSSPPRNATGFPVPGSRALPRGPLHFCKALALKAANTTPSRALSSKPKKGPSGKGQGCWGSGIAGALGAASGSLGFSAPFPRPSGPAPTPRCASLPHALPKTAPVDRSSRAARTPAGCRSYQLPAPVASQPDGPRVRG